MQHRGKHRSGKGGDGVLGPRLALMLRNWACKQGLAGSGRCGDSKRRFQPCRFLRTSVLRRLPALSSLRGQRTVKAIGWTARGNRVVSAPTLARINWTVTSLTPGILLSRATHWRIRSPFSPGWCRVQRGELKGVDDLQIFRRGFGGVVRWCAVMRPCIASCSSGASRTRYRRPVLASRSGSCSLAKMASSMTRPMHPSTFDSTLPT